MTKKEFISRTARLLRQNKARKTVPPLTKKFRIIDDEGNVSHFTAKSQPTGVLFSAEDVSQILDAFLAVAEDSLKHGEEIFFRDFGTLGLKYRPERTTFKPGTDEPVLVAGRYVPKFSFGNGLRMAAKLYQLSLEEGADDLSDDPFYDYTDIERDDASSEEIESGNADGESDE